MFQRVTSHHPVIMIFTIHGTTRISCDDCVCPTEVCKFVPYKSSSHSRSTPKMFRQGSHRRIYRVRYYGSTCSQLFFLHRRPCDPALCDSRILQLIDVTMTSERNTQTERCSRANRLLSFPLRASSVEAKI